MLVPGENDDLISNEPEEKFLFSFLLILETFCKYMAGLT